MSEPTRTPNCGTKYRIREGKYTGRWCRVLEKHPAQRFVTVMLMDAWGKETKERDAVPIKYLELV
jgi:hypothetical protein